MQPIEVDLSNGLYQARSKALVNLECENVRVNRPQVNGALSNAALYATEGIEQKATTGIINQVNRGFHVKNGAAYCVNGETIYRIDQSFVDDEEVLTPVSLGAITGTSRVSMADNGKQLMVLKPDTGEAWIIDETSGTPFQQITDLDFTANGQPKYVVFIDSFFVVTTDSKKFIKSDANNGLSWNALDFGSAEKDPDDIVAPVTFRGELFIAGTETIQSFNNIGGAAGAGFPYQASGLILPKGVFAPFSLIETNNSFMFIGGGVNESPAVWAYSGGNVSKVSTTAIDDALQKFSQDEISQAFAWTYAQAGAYFIGFSFPTRAFVYDTISQKWHERTSKITDSKGFTAKIRWRVNSMVTAYNKVLVADSQDGRIGALSPDVYTEYDGEILRAFTTVPFEATGDSFNISELELMCEPGVGTFDLDPQVRLTWSDDGGITYNNERPRGIGKIGETNRRTIWRKLGRASRYRIFRFEFSENSSFLVNKLIIKPKRGTRGR